MREGRAVAQTVELSLLVRELSEVFYKREKEASRAEDSKLELRES